MTLDNSPHLVVTTYGRNWAQAESFGQDLCLQLLRYGLPSMFQHVDAEESFRCSAKLSISTDPESIVKTIDMEPSDAFERILEWLRNLGILETEADGDLSRQASSIEEQIVLRRLTGLGYL